LPPLHCGLQHAALIFASSEMEFLDIKGLESFATCCSQSFSWRIFKENQSLLWFKITFDKICETRKLESFHE
jgi:hypothetical protein